MKKITTLLVFLSLAFTGCQPSKKVLKVAATPIPHAELLALIQPDLKEQGIELKVIEIDDYNLPNRLLAEKQVDANFFQHEPFLKEQEKAFGYRFSIIARVHMEPLGIYSAKIHSLKELRDGAIVAIPHDPTNESRALDLLALQGLITLQTQGNPLSTLLSIQDNPKKFRFHEVDAALLPRILPDVDFAVIPANFALQGGLFPDRDALVLESSCSLYANLLVGRVGEEGREDLQALARALKSEKVRQYLLKTYHGSIELASEDCKEFVK